MKLQKNLSAVLIAVAGLALAACDSSAPSNAKVDAAKADAGTACASSGTPSAAGPTFDTCLAPKGLADDWGEPSVGVNWNTEKTFAGIPDGGTVMSFGGFGAYVLRVTFDDSTSPATPTWEPTANLTIANAPRAFGDPILYTDHDTGRTLADQLVGLTPFNTVEITDDDGTLFTPSEGNGVLLPSVDHETFGGGPFAAPLVGTPDADFPTGYPNAIYYCAQTFAYAVCSLSTDGGRTFLPGLPVFTQNNCASTGGLGELHGHVKISPFDGTVFLPNGNCNGGQAVGVSSDNGTTWTVNMLPSGVSYDDRDPSVGVATDGTLYYAYRGGSVGDSHPLHVIVSHDKGATWVNDTDVGALAGLPNSVFPAAVAGDGDRAAVAFFGSTEPGDYASTDANGRSTFDGVWYLYIAVTYDAGKTWSLVNATPGDPVQRGAICGANDCRNLLDFFDASIDKEGRIVVGYEDGCVGSCLTNLHFLPKAGMARGAIARQASGKTLFAAYDDKL